MPLIWSTEIISIKLTGNNITTAFFTMKQSVVIYFNVNLLPCATKNRPRYSQRKRQTVELGVINLLFCMKCFSSSKFLNNDTDVVNNINCIKSKESPPFCCLFRAQTSPPVEAWLLSCCSFQLVFACFCSGLM